jgi:hypothetical protein
MVRTPFKVPMKSIGEILYSPEKIIDNNGNEVQAESIYEQ